MYEATIDNCPHINMFKSFYPCVLDADYDVYNNNKNLAKFKKIAENCAEVNYATFTCTKCSTGYYRAKETDICC